MITQYIITVKSIPGHPLYADSAYRLYAYLLEKLPPEDARWLHEEGCRTISQSLQYDKEKGCYFWIINILSDEVAGFLCPLLDSLAEVSIENQAFLISEKTIRQITAEQLLHQAQEETGNRKTVAFCTTTSFKQNGCYAIFPQERLILQSLMTRWNEVFPQYALEDDDAFNAMLAGVHIVDYQLRASRFFLKGVRIPGFVGFCVLEARLALPLMELWKTLLLFANYAGIGIKTGLGMGGVHTEAFQKK